MMPLNYRMYNGFWKIVSVAIVIGIAAAGYFWPPAALTVPVLILAALGSNLFGRRAFCAGLCPNGRALSAVFPRFSRNKPLPQIFRSALGRSALCAFMLFCVINLLSRTGGSLELIGRVFWFIYTLSVGVSAVMALAWKPRSWCAVCPMGTLQDTLGSVRRGEKNPVR